MIGIIWRRKGNARERDETQRQNEVEVLRCCRAAGISLDREHAARRERLGWAGFVGENYDRDLIIAFQSFFKKCNCMIGSST